MPAEEVDRELLGPPRRGWILSRIRTALNLVGAAGIAMLSGGAARSSAPFEVEWTQVPMPLRGLPPSLEGFRITQISDLHTGMSTPVPFLRRIIRQVNQLAPDLVAVTGDLVSHSRQWVRAACDLLGELTPPVVVAFGNHDYSTTAETWKSTEVADALENELRRRGIVVLRNRAWPIQRPDGRLWIVGMEDLWSQRFCPAEAFDGLGGREPVIALSHNPDSIFALARRGAQWVLCGHTHGGQIRVPVAGAMILPMRHKRFDQGLFEVDGARMYVCRGVGFRLQVRFRCRPEVVTFTLRRAEDVSENERGAAASDHGAPGTSS